MRIRILIAGAAALSLAACGTPGAPRPPSLQLAETVRDLAATRQGSTVTLTWTEPQRTTDGENIRALGPTLVCMGVNDFPMTHCDQLVADLALAQFASCKPEIGKPVRCSVTLDRTIQDANPRGQATYAIEVLNPSGRSAGLSNQVRIPTAPTEPAPSDLNFTVRRDSVEITAVADTRRLPAGLSYSYHLLRRQNGGQEIDLGVNAGIAANCPGPLPPAVPESCLQTLIFADRSFEWEKRYVYRLVPITTVSLPDGSIVDVRGDSSPELSVTTRDIFPPAPPQGLQAVASGVGQPPFVDLTWAPNTESDLAGYNVYRHEEGQPPLKINSELVKTPSVRDANVERGKTYLYLVTAIDLRNNESSTSQEASETVH